MRPRQQEAPAPRDTRHHVDRCPFCLGNEDQTPPEIMRLPATGEWAIRIVENLFPVLGDDSSQSKLTFGLQQAMDGYGRHEVIIDHSQHGIAIHEMSADHLAQLFGATQTRIGQLYDMDERLKFVLMFKNFGPDAGASMAHTHSQIIALPVVPQNLQDEVNNSHQYYEKHAQCIFCTLIDEALTFETTIYDRESGKIVRRINVGQYVVERGERFIAIKPFASRYEWEVHILPLQHQSDYQAADAADLADLARVMKRTMSRLDAVIGGAQYNYFLHSRPRGKSYDNCQASYHWHLEICPRTSIPSGFELGSGLFVNTISPEAAAEQLRAVKLPPE
jgi:UDPglucose--hexose-1-phosphate uridylyltransferase